ncbi:icarapin-like [Anabrus simplex]|uniref:icarapin-like n=1 Tax=Anabrus simplex TaxID=316456 RepID=UPI0034DCF7C5
MKTYFGILFLIVAAFAVVESFPRVGEEEVVIVPLERDADSTEESSEESGEDYGYFHIGVPSFFTGFDAFMKSLATRVRQLISSGPSEDWGKVSNATSTRKVIDGHVITVNDTTYTRDSNDSNSVFFVRVIDIKPTEVNPDEPTPSGNPDEPTPSGNPAESTPSRGDTEVETLDSGKSESSNEISKGQTEERAELLERREYFPDASYDIDVDNSIDVFETKPISLEGDIRVNKVRQDQTKKGGMFMVPHDVEIFDVEDGKPVYSYNPYHPYQISQRTEKIVT